MRAGMYWGNTERRDTGNYYHGHFMGFARPALQPRCSWWSKYEGEAGRYARNRGQMSRTRPCHHTTTCHAAPWWHLATRAMGPI